MNGRQISCTGNRSRLIWNLLAYLLCHRSECVSPEELISIIWTTRKGDTPAGAVRTAIHRARAMLEELCADEPVQFILSKNGGYIWNPNIPTLVDAEEFEHLAAGDSGDDPEACLAALALYSGKFLPSQASEMWVMPIQTYYHNLFETLVDRVIPALEKSGRYGDGIRICRKALQIDSYSEKVYQHLMRMLLVENDRQEVVRVYEEMSKLLLSTFGIMPDQESRALYREALLADKDHTVISPEVAQEQLTEQGEINGALVCDYDFFRMMYQAQARAIVRSGQVIHTALLTLKSRSQKEVPEKSLALAMDNLEKHLSRCLRKGDVIARCSSSQFMVMLPSANYENSCKVCQRCIAVFERKHPHSPVYVDYYVQPLIPSTKS
jgi:DNA-binding SARP family transcriptional activator